jgi:hypothetical protein
LARFRRFLREIFHFLKRNAWQHEPSTIGKSGIEKVERLLKVSHKPVTLFL